MDSRIDTDIKSSHCSQVDTMVNRTPVHDHRDAITLFARMGYAARSVVYLLVGGLAALAALGDRGKPWRVGNGAHRAFRQDPVSRHCPGPYWLCYLANHSSG